MATIEPPIQDWKPPLGKYQNPKNDEDDAARISEHPEQQSRRHDPSPSQQDKVALLEASGVANAFKSDGETNWPSHTQSLSVPIRAAPTAVG